MRSFFIRFLSNDLSPDSSLFYAKFKKKNGKDQIYLVAIIKITKFKIGQKWNNLKFFRPRLVNKISKFHVSLFIHDLKRPSRISKRSTKQNKNIYFGFLRAYHYFIKYDAYSSRKKKLRRISIFVIHCRFHSGLNFLPIAPDYFSYNIQGDQ